MRSAVPTVVVAWSVPSLALASLALASLALASLALASPAAAQTAPPSAATTDQRAADEQARGFFYAGQAAFEAGRYADALADFERAYELSHRPALLYNIAIAADRLRRDPQAIEAFERFLREAPEDSPQRPDVEARLTALREARGDRAPGFTITVEEDLAASAEPAPPAPAASERADGGSILPWIVVGASGAVAVAGGVLLGLGAAEADTVNGAPAGTPWTEVSDAADRAAWMTPTGIALIGVGVAGVAAGIVWWVLDVPGPTEEQPVAVRMQVGPTSVGVSGAF